MTPFGILSVSLIEDPKPLAEEQTEAITALEVSLEPCAPRIYPGLCKVPLAAESRQQKISQGFSRSVLLTFSFVVGPDEDICDLI